MIESINIFTVVILVDSKEVRPTAMKLLYYFLVVICMTAPTYGKGLGYYVLPNNATVVCPAQPCHSFQYYNDNHHEYFCDNVTFYFVEGTHIFENSQLLHITGVTNITLQGLDYKTEEGFHESIRYSTVIINCNHSSSGIVFYNCSKVSIIGITFTNCGGYLSANISSNILPLDFYHAHYELHKYRFALGIVNTEYICLHKVSVHDSVDMGMFCINAFNVNISSSSFAGNNLVRYAKCIELNTCIGGNAMFVYTSHKQCKDQFYVYNTTITNSNFSFGFDNAAFELVTASGLSFLLAQGDHYGIDVRLDTLVLYGNTGVQSGNFYYSVSQSVHYYRLHVSNCTSIYANAINPLQRILAFNHYYGSGFSVYTCLPVYTHNYTNCFPNQKLAIPNIIIIKNSQFLHNIAPNGAGLVLQSWLSHHICATNKIIFIEFCQMVNNSGFSGASLSIVLGNAYVTVTNVSIISSQKSYLHSSETNFLQSAFFIEEVQDILITNITVSDNTMSGIMLAHSSVIFNGYNLFINNRAENGGGIYILEITFISLAPPVQVVFEHNSAAKRGGAIFISVPPVLAQYYCLIQPYNLQKYPDNEDISITFKNNAADVAGAALYGGYINTCFFIQLNHSKLNIANGSLWFDSILHINQTGLSVISSDPEQVCFCQNSEVIDCSLQALNFSVLPGQTQNIYIVTVGQREGVSPGIVIITQQTIEGAVVLRQSYELTMTKCTAIKYHPVVNLSATFPDLIAVTLSLQEHDPQMKSMVFNVEKCPLGFELSPDTSNCECISYIKNNRNIICNSQSKSFYHEGNVWIGYLEESQCFVVKSDDSLQHCKTTPVNFTLSTTHNQCTHNRSGLLCGDCDAGLSVMLGSDSCGECTDNWLALIIVFAFAGIALIAFLTALNLTVSKGSINGLIFYANMIKMNDPIFLSKSSFFKWFFSWLNLNWGIESCFFNGMTNYSKTLLQFLFPVYLWFLMILIIILSHYSFKISKLIGRNSISVLATVLLLSFTNILCTCIYIITPGFYTCEPEGYRVVVWYSDAKVAYWSRDHLIIVIPALTLFIFSLLCTLLLFISPLIERYCSKYKWCRCWILKLKPLFDAYNGPYNDRCRSWTGFLLLIRCALVLIFANASATNQNMAIIALIVVTGFLLSIFGVMNGLYQKKINNYLELFFLFNLMFLAAVSLSSSAHQLYMFAFSLAFVVFLLIIAFHFMQSKLIGKLKDKFKLKKTPLKNELFFNNMQVNLMDNQHAHIENEESFELYKEDGTYVIRKRESLIWDESI